MTAMMPASLCGEDQRRIVESPADTLQTLDLSAVACIMKHVFELSSGTKSLTAMLGTLTSLDDATDNSERIDRIGLLEQLKGAVCAAQARETAAFAAFAAKQRAEHAARDTKPEHVDATSPGRWAWHDGSHRTKPGATSVSPRS